MPFSQCLQTGLKYAVMGSGKNQFLPFPSGKNRFLPLSRCQFKVVMIMVMVMITVMVMPLLMLMGMVMIMVRDWRELILAIL